MWQSKRQTLIALSAPEAEVVALSVALMPSVVIHDARQDVRLAVGCSPEVLFVVKTDSQVTLTQLRNESMTARSRFFANRFNYARDMCHGTSVYPASVKADGHTKILTGAPLKNVVSDLGLTSSLITRCICRSVPLEPPFWCKLAETLVDPEVCSLTAPWQTIPRIQSRLQECKQMM